MASGRPVTAKGGGESVRKGCWGAVVVVAGVSLIGGGWLVKSLRQTSVAPRGSLEPLTDMAPRASAFYGGPPPPIGRLPAAGVVGGPSPENTTLSQPTAMPPPTVMPSLMPDPSHPPQGTLPLAVPGPPSPPDPFTPPAMSVDPWAQRRRQAP